MLDITIFSAPAFNDSTSRWDVDEKNGKGEKIKTHDFSSKKEADGFIKAEILKNTVKGKKPMKDNKLSKEMVNANLLEDAVSTLGDTSGMVMDEGNMDIKAMMDQKLKDVLDGWNKKKEEFVNKSKNMINDIADLYFDAKLIKKNSLIAYKKEMETADVASLLIQHEVAERAVYKLHEQIEMGMAVPRTYEVLAGMQKFVLELLVAKRKFMKEMEEDLRSLNDELILKSSTNGTGDAGTGVFVSNSQKTLIQNIQILVQDAREEMGGYLAIPSKNKKLVKSTDIVQDAEVIAHQEVVHEFIKTGKKGLSSFDDEE